MVAHVLWEPQGPMRGRVRGPEREPPSGEGTDDCAVREFATALRDRPDFRMARHGISPSEDLGRQPHVDLIQEHPEREVAGH